MAQISDDRGGKSVNVDLNIVPFIDLMSVCISFLIISAVWTQVSMIQIGSSLYAKKTTDEVPKPPPRADVPFRVDIKKTGYVVVAGTMRTSIPLKEGALDTPALSQEVAKVKQTYPEKNDVIVTVADEMPYDSLITGMDALLNAGFAEIAISTEEAE